MHVKRTITIPEELARETEKYLIGKYYGNLSEVIRDGIRHLVNEYKKPGDIDSVIRFYADGRISLREAAELLGLPLRETLGILVERNAFLRYGEKELQEDLE